MITWSDRLYLGENVKKNPERLKKKLEKNKLVLGTFLITASSNKDDLFDVLDTKDCMFPYYRKKDIIVYGIANGREEALQLVVRILEDVYQETGDLKVGEYFKTE